jgi:hypothetical protein
MTSFDVFPAAPCRASSWRISVTGTGTSPGIVATDRRGGAVQARDATADRGRRIERIARSVLDRESLEDARAWLAGSEQHAGARTGGVDDRGGRRTLVP